MVTVSATVATQLKLLKSLTKTPESVVSLPQALCQIPGRGRRSACFEPCVVFEGFFVET